MFAPAALPTWLPRLVVLVLGLAAVTAVFAALADGDAGAVRQQRGQFWWRLFKAPLSTSAVVEHCWVVLWDLVRGAAQLKQPTPRDLGRRYTELLADNVGQPGFRELLIVVHDIDAHTDLVFALVNETRRRDLFHRSTTTEADARRAGIVDLASIGRDHLADGVAAALTVPLATEFHTMTFAPDSYWRGESHRLCDRPASLWRLMEELTALGVEQAILVSAAPETAGPHGLARPDSRAASASVNICSRPKRRSFATCATRRRRTAARLRDSAGAQSDRAVRFRRRLRRSVRSSPAARRADEPRL